MVERFFGKLTDKAIRRGVFHSAPDLIDAIETYLQTANEHPEPFVWTATAEQILEKVRRRRPTLDAITNQNRDSTLGNERVVVDCRAAGEGLFMGALRKRLRQRGIQVRFSSTI
jgi:hypothetical protein